MILVAFLIILLIIMTVIIVWTYCRVTCGMCNFSGHLIGKVVIVTGATSGIGLATAKDLAQRGARVILTSRSLERGAIAKQIIIDSSGNRDVHVLELSMESFSSIRKFVDAINKTEKRLDVLINNVGNYSTENRKTEDGLLIGMQINYFGPFLLTSLLVPLLIASAPSRIINVSSFVYSSGRIDFENLNMETNFNKHKIYRNAKLCTMLMTTELDRRFRCMGVTANCLHPGVVNTEMIDNLHFFFIRLVLKTLKSFFKSPWEGAQTSIYLAVSPDVEKVSGSYFKDCRLATLSSNAQNLEVARRLWDVSEILVKLK